MDSERVISWSARELNRHEQDICLPPREGTEPNKTPRYLVKAGTDCAVTRIDAIHWHGHLTRIDLGFERFEKYDAFNEGYFTFCEKGYLIKVRRDLIIFRSCQDIQPKKLPAAAACKRREERIRPVKRRKNKKPKQDQINGWTPKKTPFDRD